MYTHCLQAGQHIEDPGSRKQAEYTASAFLDILKSEFRDQKTRYAVHSVTLLGVDSVRRMLHDVNT